MLFLWSWPSGAQVGKKKGTDNKNSKSLRVKGYGFVIFVVFGLLGAQVGKEKGTDNKNSKSLRVNDLLFLLSLAFWGPRWERRRGQTTQITTP